MKSTKLFTQQNDEPNEQAEPIEPIKPIELIEPTICRKCWSRMSIHGQKLCPICIDLFNQHMDAEFDIHSINENNEREVLTDSSSSYEEHI